MKKLKALYINRSFYLYLAVIITLFIFGFFFPIVYSIAWFSLTALIIVTLTDFFLLFTAKNSLKASRILPERLSNGDENSILIQLSNQYPFQIKAKIIDEIPFQFQKRDFVITKKIEPKASTDFAYNLRPTERGVYSFGKLNIFVQTKISIVSRKFEFEGENQIATYPSFLQLRKFELLTIHNKLKLFGLKKIRRIGNTSEFEQIKEYNQGDDIRRINWKATAKKNSLMMNHFQDEKSQNIYLLIDKGRVMKTPFNGLNLLDYAINASLVVANIAVKKYDKAGLITFSKRIDLNIKADNKKIQIQKFLENLYKLETDFKETDFSQLLYATKKQINQRSLLILFTNFETIDGLQRQLPYLKSIAKKHLLVIVFFKNTELEQLTSKKATNTIEIYDKVIAEKLINEKKLIVNELNKYGIFSVLTSPEQLTINVINKYLELKARNLL